MTWSYVGQLPPSRGTGSLTSMSYVVKPSRSDDEKLHSMKRIDADGSVWQVADVDRPTVAAQLASHVRARRDEVPAVVSASELIGERHTITPFSWTVGTCDNTYYMGTDDRVAVSVDNPRRKSVVELRAVVPAHSCPYDGDYATCLLAGQPVDYCKTFVLNCHPNPQYTYSLCTGTILRSQWVLTAAHCMFDEDGTIRPASALKVHRWDDSSGELSVQAVFMDSDFGADDLFDPNNDWALLKMSSPFAAPYYDMDISDASDTTLSGLGGTVANLAFPDYAPGCSSNESGGYVVSMYSETTGELGAIYSEKMNLKFDSGPGESGSPFFFCPAGTDNNCVDDELGEIIALTTGWDGIITSVVGPKAPAFRSTAITTMDNN